MSEDDRHAELIGHLVADLRPVRPMAAPSLRAGYWVGVVVLLGAALSLFGGHALRLLDPGVDAYIWISFISAALTGILAALAAFHLNTPSGNSVWALLPLPSALIWLLTGGLGCLANWGVPGVWGASAAEAGQCLMFLLGVSLPLSAFLIIMLRRGWSQWPAITAATSGLAVAASAATLLNFVHPHNSAVLDLGVHTIAIAIIIGMNAALGGRLLTEKISRPA